MLDRRHQRVRAISGVEIFAYRERTPSRDPEEAPVAVSTFLRSAVKIAHGCLNQPSVSVGVPTKHRSFAYANPATWSL